MQHLGDRTEDSTLDFKWNTNAIAGESITRATDGTISVYKGNNTTQTTTGVTDTEDFDSLTGVHHCRIDLSADAFYVTGEDYQVVLSAATIDGKTINAVLASFTIEKGFYEVDVVKFGGSAGTFASGIPEVKVTTASSQAIIEECFTYDATATYGTADAGSLVAQIADNAGGSALTVQDIVDGVWDELKSAHTTPDSFGDYLDDEVSAAGGGSAPTVSEIADEVQTRTIAAVTTVASVTGAVGSVTGSVGSVTGDVNISATAIQAIWDAATSALTTSGSIGKLLADNIATIATLSSKLGAITGTGVNTVLGYFKALLNKAATVPSDIGGTFDPAADSTEAISEALAAGVTLATSEDAYWAAINFNRDATNDEYSVTWMKNLSAASSITLPTIQVRKRSDGTDLIASTAMSAVGATDDLKFTETTDRIVDGEAYKIIVTATIDGSTRTWASKWFSRDS